MLHLFTISLLTGSLQAAVLTPRAQVVPRQASSTSYAVSTLGYSSVNVESESTTWGAYSYYIDYMWTITTDSYFGFCSSYTPYDYSASSYESGTDTCYLYTTCSEGILYGPSSYSNDCVDSGYKCGTWQLYESWGASDAQQYLFCAYTTENTTTSLFVEKPGARVTEPASSSAITTSSSTPTTTSATPASTSSAPPATSAAGGGGGSSSNTGVIAGSVVGGVAVLAIAGVAIFWIMRRSRNNHHTGAPDQSTYVPGSGVPSYYQPQPEKPADNNMSVMPHYDPHGSVVYAQNSTGSPTGVGGTSPQPPHSPVPLYPEGFRGEMDGTGLPNMRTPPPPHSGY
ncbi:hypothetical protein K491DRAFT_686235 [Lophiostoma macrostomum CBS 122681]|uniref:Uncharacterized protein n=1 Tax=Lophiostoma macrostomum CBS 122681 TaxID=1314788 RepID=A0A6A6TTV8_9PLEO|nr:hypothetical protein K491DRAFT_686235 [Lophiostoma macrostomum CBS 122681]